MAGAASPAAVGDLVGPEGLSSAEAARRLELAGANAVPVETGPGLLAMVGEQLRDALILVLLGAGVLTAVVGDVKDTAVIALVVVGNTTIGVAQQRRAARAVAALTELAAPQARVVRDGRPRALPAADVVPGDLVLLEAGDIVPADGVLRGAHGLRVDESMLTGESLPVDKLVPGGDVEVHAGTVVVAGRGSAVTTATGSRSALGRIAESLRAQRPGPTPLQRRLARLGRQLSLAAVLLCLVVMGLGLLRGESLELMAVTAVSLAVAAVPEALPAVVTLGLALGARRMTAHNAIVRNLPAVETLGSVTVIASDKTGTLTEGRLSAAGTWAADPSLRDSLLEAVVLCNDVRLPTSENALGALGGDPTEVALLQLALAEGLDPAATRAAAPRIAELPFDAARARMSTVHRGDDEHVRLVCKGAPESVLPRCVATTPAEKEALAEADRHAHALAGEGLRVLAVAVRDIDGDEASDHPAVVGAGPDALDPDAVESGLTLLGLVALADQPRERAGSAVAACRAAGIIPVMVTGDHPGTAASVARRVGILAAGQHVRIGDDLPVAAGAAVNGDSDPRSTPVWARTAPQHKLDLVEGWQRQGHFVAMTGDGVNDAPALRRADIGVAMGRGGTEVAKQAADMVLADDDFATIVEAVHEGRRVYDNVRKFVLYGLAGGTAEILLMLVGPFVGMILPLLPAQILWVNLATHGLPGVAFGAEAADVDVMNRPPRPPDQGVLALGLWWRVLVLGTVICGLSLGTGLWVRAQGGPWQSTILVTLALAQLASALAIRSERAPTWRVPWSGSRWLVAAVLLDALLILAIVYVPAAQDLFSTEALPLDVLGLAVAAALLAPVTVELLKLPARRSRTGAGGRPVATERGR